MTLPPADTPASNSDISNKEDQGSLKRSLLCPGRAARWVIMGLVVAFLSAWTFWLPFAFPDLSYKLGIVPFSAMKELYLKTSLLDQDLRTLQNLLNTDGFQKNQDLPVPSADDHAPLKDDSFSSFPSLLEKNLAAVTSLGLLKERFSSGRSYRDLIELLKKGFAAEEGTLEALKVIETHAPQAPFSYPKIKESYAKFKNLVKEKKEHQHEEKAFIEEPSGILETFKKWIHLQKKELPSTSESREKQPLSRDLISQGGGEEATLQEDINNKKAEKFLETLALYGPYTPKQQQEINRLHAYKEVSKAIQTLEAILIKKVLRESL